MANRPRIPGEPLFEVIDDGYTCSWDQSPIVIEVHRPQETETALFTELVARIGDTIIHHARINLLSQYNCNDFQAACSHRDGNVPWHAYLITIIEPLKIRLRQHITTPATLSWEVFSLADAFKPRDPPVELVSGLFTIPNLAIVYGPPGSLKTLLLMDLLACLSGGVPWLQPLGKRREDGRQVTEVSTLWVDFDNGPRRTHERIAAVARSYALTTEHDFHYVSMPSPWLSAGSALGLAPLRAAIERYAAKAVVLDNLLLVKGNVDENSAEMGMVMAHLRQLTEDYQLLLAPIHHQRKDTGNGGRTGDRLRGHSSIEAAVDLALLVEREEGSSEVTIRSTKTRDIDVDPFGALFAYEHGVGTTTLHTARFWGISADDEHSDRAIQRTIRAVLQQKTELLKMDLTQQVKGLLPKVGINRITRVIDRMVTQHHLRVRPGDRTQQYILLPYA